MMKIDKWLLKKAFKNKDLNYKLTMIFGFFVSFPILGFIFFGIKYNILDDEFVPLFFIGVLVFSLFGFMVFRSLFDEISNISKDISLKVIEKLTGKKLQTDTDELHNIALSFKAIENQFFNTSNQLQKRSSELSALKELSELCYVTVDPAEILYVMLERSLILTNSDIGSVMIMDRKQSSFIVKASIGAGDFVKIDDRIDFETSIAKYAVINKSPIVVEDIEKDTRFGRANRPQYGSKSFVCMPIKTSIDIVGVLTISRKKDDKIFTQEEVDALTPLLSSAAFTYENLRLMGENERMGLSLKAIEKIFKVIKSSFRNSELLHAVLNEIQSIVPFDIAVVMIKAEITSDYITVFDLLANEPTSIIKGSQYLCRQGSVIDKAMKQDATMIVEDTSVLSSEIE
ncbi:MAG: GAF domain-containing protein, partial [Proteobacteria bacterium]|nr:GAF domain-containing protein [Pseudomonadota bacterium]